MLHIVPPLLWLKSGQPQQTPLNLTVCVEGNQELMFLFHRALEVLSTWLRSREPILETS